ncbi:hypothetical protein SAMN05444959_106205 [Paracoccus seriniphilus]|uniref:Uncharacterized protein n=1 Tax=Paracoccus seriniphilus TaxID=184748 RepID=A0A239PUP5_9RHOB|nr:hypothetical protein SAMN05444959_106205 [Paracoccus seriniphilus]
MASEGAARLSGSVATTLEPPAEVPIASTYLSGTDRRRVKRAFCGLFEGAVGKDVLSRTWRKTFLRKWRLKRKAVADSQEEAGNRLV